MGGACREVLSGDFNLEIDSLFVHQISCFRDEMLDFPPISVHLLDYASFHSFIFISVYSYSFGSISEFICLCSKMNWNYKLKRREDG